MLILLDLPASPKRLSAGYSFSGAREARLPWQLSKVLGAAGTVGSTIFAGNAGAEDSALATCQVLRYFRAKAMLGLPVGWAACWFHL